MEGILIKDITKENLGEVYANLKTPLPTLPAGLGSFNCLSEAMLWGWLHRFKSMYGDEGTLLLNWTMYKQVQGNVGFDRGVKATHSAV